VNKANRTATPIASAIHMSQVSIEYLERAKGDFMSAFDPVVDRAIVSRRLDQDFHMVTNGRNLKASSERMKQNRRL
jgi:hypothetical protein